MFLLVNVSLLLIGQAFETAGLRVGQVIKQVDGKLLAGKNKPQTILWNSIFNKKTPFNSSKTFEITIQ